MSNGTSNADRQSAFRKRRQEAKRKLEEQASVKGWHRVEALVYRSPEGAVKVFEWDGSSLKPVKRADRSST